MLMGLKKGHGARAARKRSGDDNIKHQGRYGGLVVNKKRMLRKTEVRAYWCDCDCGRGAYVPAKEIRRRGVERMGCLHPECTVTDYRTQLWMNPSMAVLFQLRQMKALVANKVANDWGGDAFEGIDTASESEAFARVWDLVQQQGSPDEGRVWLRRIDPDGFFADFNVTVGMDPEPVISNSKELYVSYGSYPLSVAQLASDLGVDIGLALQLRERTDSDDQFVQSLITESIEMGTTKPFTAIKPGEEGFDQVDEVVSGKKRYYDYETLALYYNKAPVGTIMRLDNPDPKKPLQEHNVQRVLEKRGLVCTNKDFEVPQDVMVSKPYKDGAGVVIPKEARVVVIKKLTSTRMRLVYDN
jgi:hypothetical protein